MVPRSGGSSTSTRLVRDRVGRVADPAGALGVDALRSRGGHTVLVAGDRPISGTELADRVDERIGELGSERRLVALSGRNHVEFVVTFLAAFEARHPLLVVDPGARGQDVIDRYRPDTVVTPHDDGATGENGAGVDIRHVVGIGESDPSRFHPDLAVLLGTSGSTGASKVVRLSRHAVESNAAAIAEYLALQPHDRAITSLPLHYCYGLSVLTSHLAAGASVLLTDTSVVDPCFREALESWGVTNLAGVPYTFELMERTDLSLLDVPSLRFVTQAGGRMDPDRIRRVAARGRANDVDLFVMYGQTEATARMAYLPPTELPDRAGSVGRAVPGGEIEVDPATSEIVYRGPNVMMGYATSPADLSRGHDLTELRTGDLGRIDHDGFLYVTGRASRFVKIYGKRIDLDDLRSRLPAGVELTGDDDGLALAVSDSVGQAHTVASRRGGSAGDSVCLTHTVARLTGLPAQRIAVATIDEFPRTAAGKIDEAALTAAVRAAVSPTAGRPDGDESPVGALLAEMVGVSRVGESDSFASLGGDSLTYVETSIRLESIVGDLPDDWHLRPVGDLDALASVQMAGRRRWTTRVDTSVVVRAIAIALIVGTHMRVFRLAGGAHALLAVVGFNFARFHLRRHADRVDVGLRSHVRNGLASIGRVALPTSIWIGLNMLVVGGYSVGALLLVNNYLGDAAREGGRWEYWYFEAFVQITLVLVAVFSLRSVRRAERRSPFLVALAAVVATVPLRFEWISLGDPYNEIFRPHTVACFVALGWLAAVSSTRLQRLATTALATAITFGYFETVGRTDQFDREMRIFLVVLALTWIPAIRLPRPLATAVGWMAAASMWTFLVHWQVWPLYTPHFDDRFAFVLTLATGVVVWVLVERVAIRRLRSAWRSARPAQQPRRPTEPSRDDAPTPALSH